ncbi:hypothetical protein K402DRAFT_420153 [Aulographum hederae CBS 113979]|uniref:Uncharacterized protein n=1 Tax=Aulographum hederae CBS 113979 TaxID=1176131 RepID=A0A6G1H4B6_9PEZI|nr:hypothetical protein K402DRAFT_420153 [Aulographum hederae CBS 113979]
MSTFVAHDQENLVHGHQVAAAAKPLNQGTKAFGAKTPAPKAPKTPFKVPLNDENAAGRTGKNLKDNGKGNANILALTSKKGGNADENAFITPAGPRTRAPLGNKTTNARAKAFQTPAPASQKTAQKTISPRLRRARVKVHQPSPAKSALEDEEEREPEYMPPRGKALLDVPSDDEWGPNKTFPQLEGANLTRGWATTYLNPVDDDGVSYLERKGKEQIAKGVEEVDRILEEGVTRDLKEMEESVRISLGLDPVSTKSADEAAIKDSRIPLKQSRYGVGTTSARIAASALAQTKSTASSRRSALASKPASSSNARPIASKPASSILSRKPLSASKAVSKELPQPEAESRYRTASAASKTTLGYAAGRTASKTARSGLGGAFEAPKEARFGKGPAVSSTTTPSNRPVSSAAGPGGIAGVSAAQMRQNAIRAAELEAETERELTLKGLSTEDEEDLGGDEEEEAGGWLNGNARGWMDVDDEDEDAEEFQLQLPEGL